MPSIKHIASGEVLTVAAAPFFSAGIWECGDQRFTDPSGAEYSPIESAPKVSPVEFRLLFTAGERVAITAARTSDPVINDFYSIVEDPRLTHVDLGLQSTRDAVDYLIVQGLVAAARREVILSGVLQ